ncbi:hypothetical protein GIB67_042161 [Kingdonia uniflora]|uniref:Uncharacterized protein n=1 Tax=Kingdonia uniflora TaxID=39325 RepID=A0A7J7NWS1_9MAGN|nr:hypothetical protein GIB67_042161 [Kingdonia uniflora]
MRLSDLSSSNYMKRWTKDAKLGTLVDSNGEPVHVECYPSLCWQSSELTCMVLKIAINGVFSTKCMEFTKGCLARVQEEVDNFLKADLEEVTDLEGDKNLSTTKVGEVTNQDLAGANITLHYEPRKKRNGKVGRIKGALEKGKEKKRTCPKQNGLLWFGLIVICDSVYCFGPYYGRLWFDGFSKEDMNHMMNSITVKWGGDGIELIYVGRIRGSPLNLNGDGGGDGRWEPKW